MATTGNQPFEPSSKQVLILSIISSLLISWLYISNSHVISPDSLLYIFTAQTFLDNGLEAAVETYPWPFLSIIIAAIHSFTGLSLQLSGHLFIALTYAALTCTFIVLTRDLGGSTRTQLLALLVISILPTLNDYRDYITRDSGFWLFVLLSLQQLLRFSLNRHFRHVLAWFFLTLTAILFRTEAVFFALFAPLALLTNSDFGLKDRIKKAAICYSLLACIALVGIVFIFATPQLSDKLRLITEIASLADFFKATVNEFERIVSAFSQQAPHEFAANDMGVIVGTGLIGLVIYTLLHALTLPYLILFAWQYKQPLFSSSQYKSYLSTFLLIIFSYLLLLSFRKYFMTDRFCIAAVLIVMLALAFRIEQLWQQPGKFHWRRIAIIFLLLIPALDSMISSGSSKEYIKNAADWIKENKTPEQTLLTNTQQIAVLGANCWHQCLTLETKNLAQLAQSQNPDLLAIRIKDKETMELKKVNALLSSQHWELLQTFSNEKDDKVFILSFKPEATHSSP